MPKGFKHGYRYTKLYSVWCSMKKRCRNPNDPSFSYYGGRGVLYFDGWETFIPFHDWSIKNGYKESLELDRIDNNGNYCPDNCRWVDKITNGSNKRNNVLVTAFGETKTIAQWSREYDINRNTFYNRIFKYSWNPELALTKEVRKLNAKKKN